MTEPFVVLDFPASPSRPAGTLLFERPRRVISAQSPGDVASVLREADAAANSGAHVVGFLTYEAAPAFDDALIVQPPKALPHAWFAVFDAPRPAPPRSSPEPAIAHWRETEPASRYARAVETIRDAIGRGDVYQVNFTMQLDVEVTGESGALYHRLLAAQGPGYGAWINAGDFEILSASPELFFARRQRHIVTMPMKGTARRGRWLGEDERRASTLAASDKERAENVMIVDLIRNDLGRVAETGSVRVTSLFDVERRPTVLQMTSTIEATLRDGVSTGDVFRALFPCGSVTGAPKIAATQLIAALEDTPRGVYCGAIGHMTRDESTFSVAIRTLTLPGASSEPTARTGTYGVGSGITWDSAQAAEYDEVIAKAAILNADLPTFDLIETLRLEDGVYRRLERHMARLEESARYFGFPHEAVVAEARRLLGAHAHDAPAVPARVRVCVGAGARGTLQTTPLPLSHSAPERVALADTPVRSANRFLFHKTTHRAVYERARAAHPDAFDVLLWNEHGTLTEFTIGNVVAEIGGALCTPARESGLLAGVFRAELLESGTIIERDIHRDEIAAATRLWLVNSVREWVSVILER